MQKSDSIKELATALAKAQAEMKNPVFDAVNPHFKNKYATLAAVRNATVPVLAKYGLSVLQPLSATDGGIKCGVILLHESGEWLELDGLEIPVSKADAQGVVSSCTYAKRTTLQSCLVVVGDDDDDGNAAAKAAPKTVAADTWDACSEEEKQYLQVIADSALKFLDAKDFAAAIAYIESMKLDAEERTALWSRFSSQHRSGMKAASQQLKKVA